MHVQHADLPLAFGERVAQPTENVRSNQQLAIAVVAVASCRPLRPSIHGNSGGGGGDDGGDGSDGAWRAN